MPDPGQQALPVLLVDHHADVTVYPCGPEIRIAGAVDSMRGKAEKARVHLEVEGGLLDLLLLLQGELGEGVIEGVGDAVGHGW